MKKIIFIIIFLSILASGCEQTGTLEPESTYKEKTVVFANLKSEVNFEGVTFTRTLPLDSTFDIKKAELKTVTAYMKINGIQIIPLQYDSIGVYKPRSFLRIKEGYTYELFANYEGKSIYSKTTTPYIPKVTSAKLIDNKFIEAKITPGNNEVYGAAWFIAPKNILQIVKRASDFLEIVKPSEVNSSAAITIKTQDIPPEYSVDIYPSKTYVKVYSFDMPYYDYFKTKSNNRQVQNSFTQGGGQINWNVLGKDVIGLFIGSAESLSISPR